MAGGHHCGDGRGPLIGERIRLLQQPLQKPFIHAAAEAHTPVDNNNRHALVVAISQSLIGVDIDFFDGQAVRFENSLRLIAQTAARSSVEDGLNALHRG